MNKRILVFIDWYRPGYRAGGPITSLANLVDHLTQAASDQPGNQDDHLSFHILTTNTDHMSDTPYEGIEANRWIDRGERVRVCYLSQEQLGRKRLGELAREAACDTWYINGVYSWYFSIFPVLLSRRVKPSLVLIAPRGMLSPHAIRVKSIKKNLFIMAARLYGLYRGVHFHATNGTEAEAIRDSLGANTRVRIAPNLPARIPREAPASRDKKSGSLRLVSLARISPEKNTLQALRILSQISTGQVSLSLVGEIGPAGYWQSCRELIERLPANIRVDHAGSLPPEKLPGVFQQSHLLFLPTTGENHGHAILECLSHGLPALISDQTPWTDLQEHQAGWALPLDREEDFIRILEQCLAMEQEEYESKSRAARQYAKRFSEDPEILRMNQMLFSHE